MVILLLLAVHGNDANETPHIVRFEYTDSR